MEHESENTRVVPGPRPLPTGASKDELARFILDRVLEQADRTDETNDLRRRAT